MAMPGVCVRVSALRAVSCAVLAAVGLVIAFGSAAEARTRHHHYYHRAYHHHQRYGYAFHHWRSHRYAHHGRRHRYFGRSPVEREAESGHMLHPAGVAAIVVDANSGRTLYSLNANQPRHPASVTKVMTLYLLFEQMEKGRLHLASPLTISQHAANQKPSKLGLDPGDTIDVEDAIKAVVTKSANDIAVAIAENIGGDEASFAEMMTAKAHALGMRDTHFANASGLPNREQITTAHDLAILGRAIQDRFPRYYRYFSTHSFAFNGAVIRNHNHLLGRIEGVDGIKTGYTAASGFNLLSSVHRDGRHIVAVVLGGRTAGARDRLMANLIEDHIDNSAGVRTARAISEEAPAERVAEAVEQEPAPPQTHRRSPPAKVALADEDDRDGPARPANARTADSDDDQESDLAPIPVPSPRRAPTEKLAAAAPHARLAFAPMTDDRPRPAFVSGLRKAATDSADAKQAGAKTAVLASDGSTNSGQGKISLRALSAPTTPTSLKHVEPERSQVAERSQIAKSREARPANPGWMIQLGATEDAEKASALLERAKNQGNLLPSSARAFTERVQKGQETLYRARFAGLEEHSAEAACRSLKRSGFSCFATKE